MRKLVALTMLAAALAAPALMAGTAAAGTSSVVNISVAKGSRHYNQTMFIAKSGLVRINFTNGSSSLHNVSLEHNGEFEYGATLTIGKSATTTFLTLASGTYHLYSSVGKDEDTGMSATLVVK